MKKNRFARLFAGIQIERVQLDITYVRDEHSPIVYACKVRRQNSYEVTLGNVFSDIVELIDTVLEETACQLAPQELNIAFPKNINTFAHFTLDRRGIRDSQETLSWQEIREFVAKNGTVILHKEQSNWKEKYL